MTPTPPPSSECSPALRVIPVTERRTRELFLRLPWSLYRDDPAWIPPLLAERRQHLSPRNPFYRHAEVRTWLALRGNAPVGRISAQVDRLHLERYEDATGFFGLLEAVDDREVFSALLETAGNWLRSQGMHRVLGPFNLSINEECGLLVEGFDTPPVIMMGHARPWYAERLAAEGFVKARDLLAYRIRTDFPHPPYLAGLAARLGERVRLRPLRKAAFEEDLAIIREIFEDAWANNWGFVPFTSEEFRELGRNLRFLVPPEFVRIAEVDGQPAAMMVVFPNLNEAVADLDGRLFPGGWLKLLWRIKVRGLKTGRVPLMGVRQAFQGSRTGATLALMMITDLQPAVRKRGMEEAEMGWILEDNQGMRNIIEALGGEPYKRYRIFSKDL